MAGCVFVVKYQINYYAYVTGEAVCVVGGASGGANKYIRVAMAPLALLAPLPLLIEEEDSEDEEDPLGCYSARRKRHLYDISHHNVNDTEV
ncbi:hypothetical protein NQZ68_016900 [Dissostichus eleginoides]|nr:hypothetical protein NQZ68_016900 [Dissostichus eleginoides]